MSDVLDKIRRETPKKRGPLARARKLNPGQDSAGLTQKAAEILAKYLPAAAQAWVDGLKANKAIFNSMTKKFEETDVADHKVRSECAEKIWHNVVGRPIERSMQVTGSYKELSQVLDELKQSPEARRLLPPELWGMIGPEPSGQTTTEGKESAPEDSEQKTP